MYGNIAYSSGGIVRPTTVKRFIQIYDADNIKATLDEYFNVSIYNEITCDNSTPIRIMEQPDGYTGNSGNLTANMSVSVVGGTGEYTYQWHSISANDYNYTPYATIYSNWLFRGEKIAGATSSTYSAQVNQNIYYCCVITDSEGNYV